MDARQHTPAATPTPNQREYRNLPISFTPPRHLRFRQWVQTIIAICGALILPATGLDIETEKQQLEAARASAVAKAGAEARANLASRYEKALEKQLASAVKAGNLDDAVALRSELAGLKLGEFTVPEKDPVGTVPVITKLRDVWRTEEARIRQTESNAAEKVRTDYSKELQAREVQLTKEGKLSDALALRQLRLSLSPASPPPTAPAATEPPTQPGPQGQYPVPLVRPGRVRFAGWFKGGKPLESEATTAFDDVVQVIAYGEDKWAILRANGDMLTNSGRTASGVAWMHGFNGTLAMTMRDGSVTMNGDRPDLQPPAGSGSFAYVTVGYGPHFLGLQRDGTAVTWGKNYTPPKDGQKPSRDHHLKAPPPEQLQNIRAVAAGYQHSSLITREGDLRFWTLDGVMPALKNRGKITRILTGKHHAFWVLNEKSDLIEINDDSGAAKKIAERVSDIAVNMAARGGYLWQDRNGEWPYDGKTANHAALHKVFKGMPSSQFAACFAKGEDGRSITGPCWIAWIEPSGSMAIPAPELARD